MGIIYSILTRKKQFDEKNEQELHDLLIRLPKYGLLKQTKSGFTYVDVDDRYISESVKVLKPFGFCSPPYFGEGMVGAHITVLYENEAKEVNILDALGTQVHFDIVELKMVEPGGTWGNSKLFIVVVNSDYLNSFREQAGLNEMNQEFHITIGTLYEESKLSF